MRKIIVLFVVLSFSYLSEAQKHKADFKSKVDSVLIAKPKTYKEISSYLKFFRKDTQQLKILIKTFAEKEYLDGKTYSENLLGIQYRNYTQLQKAIDTHKQALKTAENANSIEFRIFSLNMLGVDYRRMDANRTALDYNYEALSLAETVENPSLGIRRSIAVSYNSMGNIYMLLKQYDLAIKQFKKSQRIEEDIDNQLGLAINNQNIGHAKDAQGKNDETLAYYKKSLAINESLDNELGQMICNSSIANIYLQEDQAEEALEIINKNLPVAIRLGDKYYLTYQYLNLGWAQTKLNQLKEAELSLTKGLELAQENEIPSAISSAYSYLSEYYNQKNNFKEALNYYQLAKEYEEKISNERNSQYVNDLIIKYESERKNNQIEELAKQNEIAELKLVRNSNLFIIFIMALVLIATVLYFWYRQRFLKNEKKILTLEQDVLRSQMNPHFIFNALNSIKQYIITDEQKNAVHYLNKFSKLIRKILESSSIKEVSLAQELETMDLYITIENIRFSNEIDFNISVDETIDLDKIMVLPLVLQPFLENSLWHGLSSKKDEKKINIDVKQSDTHFFQVSIEDNGIGRKESSKIKAKKSFQKKSIGIDLTRERLNNFVKNGNRPFSIVFKDLIVKTLSYMDLNSNLQDKDIKRLYSIVDVYNPKSYCCYAIAP